MLAPGFMNSVYILNTLNVLWNSTWVRGLEELQKQ